MYNESEINKLSITQKYIEYIPSLRVFETGYCKGFLSRGIQLLKQHYGNIQDSEIYPGECTQLKMFNCILLLLNPQQTKVS